MNGTGNEGRICAVAVPYMVGMSEPIVGRYCRFSVQRENASAAVIHLEAALARGATSALPRL